MQTILQFARSLVANYAKWDELSQSYMLRLANIPDFDLHEFAAIFMLDESSALEATGPDNACYELEMRPALLKWMKDTTDVDNQLEFNYVWREGITKYFSKDMQALINDACICHTHERMNDGHMYLRHKLNGDVYWEKRA